MIPDALSSLAIFAEVSTALAGFSGIVIAFGRRSWSELTPLEMRRLSNLFALSGTVLLVSLTGISLLHLSGMPNAGYWRGGSGVLFVVGSAWLALDWLKVKRLAAAERQKLNSAVLYSYNSLAVVTLLAQLVNAVAWAAPSLVFLGLALFVAFAFQQFILAVRMDSGGR